MRKFIKVPIKGSFENMFLVGLEDEKSPGSLHPSFILNVPVIETAANSIIAFAEECVLLGKLDKSKEFTNFPET